MAPVIEFRFKLEKETTGALRYQEVDKKGEVIEQALGQDRHAPTRFYGALIHDSTLG
jgi:hypothetical protein